MKDGDIIQVAHVVRDIDQAMKRYWETFHIGPWDVYTFAPPEVRDSMAVSYTHLTLPTTPYV